VPLPSARAVRITAATIPVAMRLSSTGRRGVRELQLLASYVIAKLREAGVTPERAFVRALTMQVYVDPDRRPRLGVTPSRLVGSITRQWTLRSLGGDGEEALRTRVRRQVAALDRLDLPALAAEWHQEEVIDV
jgi:hypothetical protein